MQGTEDNHFKGQETVEQDHVEILKVKWHVLFNLISSVDLQDPTGPMHQLFTFPLFSLLTFYAISSEFLWFWVSFRFWSFGCFTVHSLLSFDFDLSSGFNNPLWSSSSCFSLCHCRTLLVTLLHRIH